MVESDGITKPVSGEPGSGEAAQALRAILQTQYLRYLIISSWAVGLLAVVGPIAAAMVPKNHRAAANGPTTASRPTAQLEMIR